MRQVKKKRGCRAAERKERGKKGRDEKEEEKRGVNDAFILFKFYY